MHINTCLLLQKFRQIARPAGGNLICSEYLDGRRNVRLGVLYP